MGPSQPLFILILFARLLYAFQVISSGIIFIALSIYLSMCYYSDLDKMEFKLTSLSSSIPSPRSAAASYLGLLSLPAPSFLSLHFSLPCSFPQLTQGLFRVTTTREVPHSPRAMPPPQLLGDTLRHQRGPGQPTVEGHSIAASWPPLYEA